jgi:hypothetical protein
MLRGFCLTSPETAGSANIKNSANLLERPANGSAAIAMANAKASISRTATIISAYTRASII